MEQRVEALEKLLLDLNAQVGAMRSVLHALIATHPDQSALDAVLADQKLKLEATLVASVASDDQIASCIGLLDSLRNTAR